MSESQPQFTRQATRSRPAIASSKDDANGNMHFVVDDATLASCIANGEDIGPHIRAAFEAGQPDALLHQLRSFSKKKEVEIEELCKVHYEEFIHAVDELRYVLVDADELKHGLNMQNMEMQEVGSSLLRKLEELIEAHGVKSNLADAIEQLKKCKLVLDLCAKVKEAIGANSYYQALKTLDHIERDHLRNIPARILRRYVERQIPICRAHIERKVNVEFSDWLVHIRSIAKDIGKQAVGRASFARQREVELGERQRQAEEQTRSGQKAVSYILEVEDAEEEGSVLKFDVTPVYRAHYIHTCLGLRDAFRAYYYDNRKLQLNSDLQFTSGQFVPQAFNHYCAHVAGFFIVEDKVMRTAGGLITSTQVDNLWEIAVGCLRGVMQEQFGRMATSQHMLLLKDDVTLLCGTLRRYGFQVQPVLDVLDLTRDQYHELLLADSLRQMNDTLANDKFEQMVMRKEYEYSMNVLAFHIQSTDIMPAFPYIAPFSATVPECCRIVRSFIDASVSFLQHSGQMDQYDAVKKYLDRLLTDVLNAAMLKIIHTPTLAVSHAMQIAANMTVLERACTFFAQHAAKLCGIPARLVDRAHRGLASNGMHILVGLRSVLRESQLVAYETMLKLVCSKIEDMMAPQDQIAWMAAEAPLNGHEYVIDLRIYLETMMETARQLLPLEAFEKVSSGMVRHIRDRLVVALCGPEPRRFNLFAIQGLATDLEELEAFADEQYVSSGLSLIPGSTPLKSHLATAKQLVTLLLSNQPEHYTSRPVKERNYFALEDEMVIAVCDKFKDPADVNSIFGGVVGWNAKMMNKKKALDNLARALREKSSGRPQY